MLPKRTLQREVTISGVGIHTGQEVRLILKPSKSGTIFFRRTDLANLEIPLDPLKVEARNCSALIFESGSVQTIEHLLATLYVFGIDSLEVQLDGAEIPALDGSAAPLCARLLDAGVQNLPQEKRAVRISRPFVLREAGASLSFSPDEDFRLSYAIDFPHPAIGRESFSLLLTRRAFLEQIAPARTFGFLKDVPELRRKGLAGGGSLDNALVLDEKKVINGPLRFSDEFVRHKLLDLIGDLALFGHPLIGHFQADRAGHSLHQRAVRFLLENPSFWTFEPGVAPLYLEG
jgi:UDP-3-O-[3-hydroxymyristoyl] N-acetylglucosamine deacetylase